jgi:hypothetical protein
MQLQDARFWFSDLADDPAPKSPYQNYLDLRQALAELPPAPGRPLGFRLGRQVIAYGDYRIFGPANWGNAGRYTWDAAKAVWRTRSWRLDAFWARQVRYQKEEFDDRHLDFDVLALYGQCAYAPEQKLDLFLIRKFSSGGEVRGESGPGVSRVNTAGLHARGAWRSLDYRATLAWQFGGYGRDRVRAWGLALRAGWGPPFRLSPRLTAGFAQGSGDADPNDGVHGAFDGVFGAVDKFYGRMNLFSWSNLQDFELGLGLEPVKQAKLSLRWHLFRLSQARDAWYYGSGRPMRRDPSGSSGRDLGQELDLILSWRAGRSLKLMGGLCWFWPGEFIANTGPADRASWAFLQMQFTF